MCSEYRTRAFMMLKQVSLKSFLRFLGSVLELVGEGFE